MGPRPLDSPAPPVVGGTLTTGQAATLLSCSRQHVVDLCEDGRLPYTSIGKHRRVSRRDVEALRSRTDRLSREERRSLWLAYGVAGKLALDPQSAIEIARVQIGRMRKAARGQALDVLDEWERLLAGPVDELLRSLVDASPRGRELRQNSPFAGVLDGDERERLLTSWRAHDRGDSR